MAQAALDLLSTPQCTDAAAELAEHGGMLGAGTARPGDPNRARDSDSGSPRVNGGGGNLRFGSDAEFWGYIRRDAARRLEFEVRFVVQLDSHARAKYLEGVERKRRPEGYRRLRAAVAAALSLKTDA